MTGDGRIFVFVEALVLRGVFGSEIKRIAGVIRRRKIR